MGKVGTEKEGEAEGGGRSRKQGKAEGRGEASGKRATYLF